MSIRLFKTLTRAERGHVVQSAGLSARLIVIVTILLIQPGRALGQVTVDPNNNHLFEPAPGGVHCYSDPSSVLRVPGKIVRTVTRSKKNKRKIISTRTRFYSLKELNKKKLRSMKQKRVSKKKLKKASKSLAQALTNANASCNRVGSVYLRWFPSENAKGYYVYVMDLRGETLLREAIVPNGCTLDGVDGYTSGVCSYHYGSPQPGAVQIRVSAFNNSGESPKSEPF